MHNLRHATQFILTMINCSFLLLVGFGGILIMKNKKEYQEQLNHSSINMLFYFNFRKMLLHENQYVYWL